jgi:ubiquinone/menaquinone biosynthesis C-methylase UbiE
MRILDVGSGAGDVAFLAAELVGPRVKSSVSISTVPPSRSRVNARNRWG